MHSDYLERCLTPELLEQLGDAVTVIDADWTYRFASRQAVEIIGRPLDEIIGAPVWEIFPEVVGTPQYDACVRAMTQRTREVLSWYFDSVGRWYEQHAIPVADGLLILVNDVTEAQAQAHRSEELVAVGEELARAATVEDVNAAIVARVFPLLGAAAGSIILANEEYRVLRAVGWYGLEESDAEKFAEFPIDSPTPSSAAYRLQRAVYVDDTDDARESYPEVAAVLQHLGGHSAAAVPLTTAGIRLGAMSLTFPPEREISVGDRQFLGTVAAMAAQAIMRARLLDVERQSIAALQRSLLPSAVPEVADVAIAVRYLASNSTTDVGGDWYDVIPLPAGSVGLVMGDVEGHDLAAAALMGLIRSAVRAYALEEHPPSIVLARANTFLAGLGLGRIVTVAYAQLYPAERLITTVTAGHPALQVAAPSGEAFEVPTDLGPPLGVTDAGMHWPETTSTLPARSVLALFTDGLVETRAGDLETAITALRDDLRAHRDLSAEDIADVLLAARPESSHDDVALLVARLTADEISVRTLTRRLPPTPASVFLARRFTVQLLREWGLPVEAVEAAAMVVSELATNAARHSEDQIEVGLSYEDAVLRVEVGDTSHRMPTPVLLAEEINAEATEGRGLLLVDAVADRWGVESEGLSKRVWAEFDVPLP